MTIGRLLHGPRCVKCGESDRRQPVLFRNAKSCNRPMLGPKKIACISIPESGHMNPLLNLAAALCKLGNEVTVFTFAFAQNKYQGKVEAMGATFVGLSPNLSEEEADSQTKALDGPHFMLYAELMEAQLREWLALHKPDVLACDFATFAPFTPCHDLGIPVVVNVPGPTIVLKSMLQVNGVALVQVKLDAVDPKPECNRFVGHHGFNPLILTGAIL